MCSVCRYESTRSACPLLCLWRTAGAPAGSWTAATGDTAPWVGVHFSHYVIVTGVRIAGAGDRDEYVMDFRLSYRLQSGSFYEYYRDATGVVVVSVALYNSTSFALLD